MMKTEIRKEEEGSLDFIRVTINKERRRTWHRKSRT